MFRKVPPKLYLVLFTCSLAATAQDSRHFKLSYAFTVSGVHPVDDVRIWVPLAHSDEFQDVKVISAKGDLPLKQMRESKYGNEMYYAETSHAKQPNLHFEIVYDVIRRERLVLGVERPRLTTAKLSSKETKADLEANQLVPTTGQPNELAALATQGRKLPIDKARAIYDYVFSSVRYDKSGTGWGRGDVLWVCESRRGNCTDFHSLFIAMARSQGIPARFEIGFLVPSGEKSGEIAGYHCWADFFVPQYGWVPVDISEAWNHQEKLHYYFGAHDADRVQFTVGRDLELNPKQQGDPLNYFVYPYVEMGGIPYSTVSHTFSFAEVGNAMAESQ